jgi:hypothetical protein
MISFPVDYLIDPDCFDFDYSDPFNLIDFRDDDGYVNFEMMRV